MPSEAGSVLTGIESPLLVPCAAAADCFLGVLDTEAPASVADAPHGLEREQNLTLDQVIAGRPYRDCVLGMFCEWPPLGCTCI